MAMFNHKEYFDLSNFPKDSKYHNSSNKKVPGKMKNEYLGKNIIVEVIALKSKSYIVITSDNKEECKHKGHN